MPKFYKRLKELRASHNISQAELAKFIDMSKSSVNMYERGEREPGLETLEAIADLFNVDMDYLLGKSDIPNKSGLSSAFTYTLVPPHFDLTLLEKEIVAAYRHADELDRRLVLRTLKIDAEERKTDIPGVG